jgi:hypothetical protein
VHVAPALATLIVIMSVSTYGVWLLMAGAAPEASAGTIGISRGADAGAVSVPP